MNAKTRLAKLESTIKPQPTTAIQHRDDDPGVVTQERIARVFKVLAEMRERGELPDRGSFDWSVPILDNPRLERCRIAIFNAREAEQLRQEQVGTETQAIQSLANGRH